MCTGGGSKHELPFLYRQCAARWVCSYPPDPVRMGVQALASLNRTNRQRVTSSIGEEKTRQRTNSVQATIPGSASYHRMQARWRPGTAERLIPRRVKPVGSLVQPVGPVRRCAAPFTVPVPSPTESAGIRFERPWACAVSMISKASGVLLARLVFGVRLLCCWSPCQDWRNQQSAR